MRTRCNCNSCASFVLLALLTVGLPSSLGAGSLPAELEEALEASLPRLVELRHRIHSNPELGNREFETAALVAEHLRGLGLEVETEVAHTGVVALLRGGRPGPVVAVRADMDALPVTEATDLPFRSTRRTEYLGQEVGVAHACGHDVHTAVALGAASVLAAVREELPGSVLFLFQPAEEGAPPGEEGGALLMLKEGAFDDPAPEAVFGLHAFPDLEVGQIGYLEGPAYAAADHFVATIRGRQSHGAQPHLSVDPVVMAAQAVQALQTIRSRNLPPLEPSVISVGIIRGGERFNIIPSEVRLEGTVRTYRPEAQAAVERRMGEILAGVTAAGGGSYELDYRHQVPATVNDRELAARMRPSLQQTVGESGVVEVEPTLAGEDFAYFAERVPGFNFRLGVRAPGGESGGLHTPDFRADDGSIEVGARVMTRLVWDYLHDGAR